MIFLKKFLSTTFFFLNKSGFQIILFFKYLIYNKKIKMPQKTIRNANEFYSTLKTLNMFLSKKIESNYNLQIKNILKNIENDFNIFLKNYEKKEGKEKILKNINYLLAYFKKKIKKPFLDYLKKEIFFQQKKLTTKGEIKILLFLSKTKLLLYFLKKCLLIDPKDLFCLEKDSLEWKILKNKIIEIEINTKKKSKNDYKYLGDKMEIFKFNLAKENKALLPFTDIYQFLSEHNYPLNINNYKKNDKKQVKGVFNIINCVRSLLSFFDDNIKEKSELMRYFTDTNFCYNLYQLTENKFVNYLQSFVLETIQTNIIFYTKKEKINSFINKKSGYNFFWKILNDNFNIKNLENEKIIDFSQNFDNSRIPIRFMSDEKINFLSVIKKKEIKYELKNIIIHIHGGGFVTMSSGSHQNYLRKFSKEAKACIFSIDYPKAPKNNYKTIINSIFISYISILHIIENCLKLKNYKIILIGDSSGANLSHSLLNWIIINKLKKPEACILNYPLMSLNFKYTKSLLYSLNDYFLNINFLLFCRKSYLTENANLNDFMIEPLETPKKLLKEFPKIFLMICERDPLHDDALRYAVKLFLLKARLKVYRFKHLSHGLLNLAVPGGLQDAYFLIEKNLDILNAVFNRD